MGTQLTIDQTLFHKNKNNDDCDVWDDLYHVDYKIDEESIKFCAQSIGARNTYVRSMGENGFVVTMLWDLISYNVLVKNKIIFSRIESSAPEDFTKIARKIDFDGHSILCENTNMFMKDVVNWFKNPNLKRYYAKSCKLWNFDHKLPLSLLDILHVSPKVEYVMMTFDTVEKFMEELNNYIEKKTGQLKSFGMSCKCREKWRPLLEDKIKEFLKKKNADNFEKYCAVFDYSRYYAEVIIKFS